MAEDLLTDYNADGKISWLAFGDSITAGVGDQGGDTGYPGRLEILAGIPVDNQGIPGEALTIGGVERFPATLRASDADMVFVMEGANDAVFRVSAENYRNSLQKLINVALVLGKTPLLFTLPPPCCEHASLTTFVASYSEILRQLAILNSVNMVDLEKAWWTTCSDISNCQLYNLPEGLHPNSQGYDAMTQTVLATLYGIDIFADGGAAELEETLGLAEGSVIVKPAISD